MRPGQPLSPTMPARLALRTRMFRLTKKGPIMTAATSFIDYWNRKVAKFTIFDVKLAQGAAMAFMLIIVKFFPQIMGLSVWWFVAFAILCALRPVYIFWIKADDSSQEREAADPMSR